MSVTITQYKQTDIVLMQYSTYPVRTFEINIDLSGGKVYFIVKENIDDENVDAVIFKTVTDITYSDATEKSQANIELSDSDWDFTLTADANGEYTYWYAIEFEDSDGKRDTPFWGKATIIRNPKKTTV